MDVPCSEVKAKENADMTNVVLGATVPGRRQDWNVKESTYSVQEEESMVCVPFREGMGSVGSPYAPK